jgi:hypothetical protein
MTTRRKFPIFLLPFGGRVLTDLRSALARDNPVYHPEPRRRRGISFRSPITLSLRDPSVRAGLALSARLRMTLYSVPHLPRERLRIEWCVDLGVVVEVDKNIAPLRFCFSGDEFRIGRLLSLAPKFQSRGPPIQRAFAVAAGVELGVAMKTAINEIGR